MLRATSQDRRMASALGLNVGMFYVMAFAIGCFMAGLGGAIVVPTQAAVLGMGVDALVIAFVVVVIGGGFVAASKWRPRSERSSSVRCARAGIQFFPELELAVPYVIAAGVLLVRPTGLFGMPARRCRSDRRSRCGCSSEFPLPLAAVDVIRRSSFGSGLSVGTHQIAAACIFGRSLRRSQRWGSTYYSAGYTGLLSFSAIRLIFGVGACCRAASRSRAVSASAFDGIHYPRWSGFCAVCPHSALFGYICVRHTQIFFGILTLAISRCIYSPALNLLLGHRRQRRHAGAAPGSPSGRSASRPLRVFPAVHHQSYYLPRGSRFFSSICVFAHVADRPFAVRESVAGDPR